MIDDRRSYNLTSALLLMMVNVSDWCSIYTRAKLYYRQFVYSIVGS